MRPEVLQPGNGGEVDEARITKARRSDRQPAEDLIRHEIPIAAVDERGDTDGSGRRTSAPSGIHSSIPEFTPAPELSPVPAVTPAVFELSMVTRMSNGLSPVASTPFDAAPVRPRNRPMPLRL